MMPQNNARTALWFSCFYLSDVSISLSSPHLIGLCRCVLSQLIAMCAVKHVVRPLVSLEPSRAKPDVNWVGQVNPLGNRERPLLLSLSPQSSERHREIRCTEVFHVDGSGEQSRLISVGSKIADFSAAFLQNQTKQVGWGVVNVNTVDTLGWSSLAFPPSS